MRSRGKRFRRATIEPIERRTLLSTTFYVDASASGAVHDGTSWTTAFVDLQQGLAAAVAGDEIHVADGTYKPTQTIDRAISFVLTNDIHLIGGYGGSGAVDPNARGSATVLSGEIGISGASDNSLHVISATGPGLSVLIDGFTITQASAGAFFILNADATISNCTFTQNTTAGWGAAIYTSYGKLTVNESVFSSNSATNYGYGGAVFGDGEMDFADCSFYGNSTMWAGGAISGRQLKLTNCDFADNSAVGWGGAVNTDAGTFDTCTFNRNRSVGDAGAVMSFAASYRKCAFTGNSAGLSGGAIVDFYGAKLEQCILVGNSAIRSGGAVFSFTAYAVPVAPIVRDCTLVGNSAGISGGAISCLAGLVLSNTIVWGNTAASSSGIESLASPSFISWSDTQDGWTGSGNISADPNFARNPTPGADAVWGTEDDDYGDLRLQAASPCIDAGDNSAVPAGAVTDLAGNPRIVDLPGVRDFGVRVDMGAYEVQSAGSYLFDAAQASLRMSFPFDVNPATLTSSDLVLTNAATASPVSFSATFSYDAVTRSATWQFQTPLPDGDYRATIVAGSVADTLGNPLSTNILCNFFVLAGDATGDRKVDINDLAILAANWNGSGKVFSQGDFNYDGQVDAIDLGILSSRWQQVMPPPVAPAQPVALGKRAPTRTAARVISLVT